MYLISNLLVPPVSHKARTAMMMAHSEVVPGLVPGWRRGIHPEKTVYVCMIVYAYTFLIFSKGAIDRTKHFMFIYLCAIHTHTRLIFYCSDE